MKLVQKNFLLHATVAVMVAGSANTASAQSYSDPFASCRDNVTTSAGALNVRDTPAT